MKSSVKTQVASLLCLFTILAFSVSSVRSPKAAGPWYVTPGGSDSNTCLSPAFACATINGVLDKESFVWGDTVLVMSGVYTGTGDAVVLLSKSANLSGGWDGMFSSQTGISVLDGENTRPVITTSNVIEVSLEYFKITNGAVGIENSGTLTLNHCNISGNSGGIVGGIANVGTLTLNHCSISNNTGDPVGGIFNYGTLTLNHCSVSNNTGSTVGGLFGGAVVNNSAFTDNQAVGNNASGGGIFIFGSFNLNNSTVSHNRPTGIYLVGDESNEGILTITNSTITANSGEGIRNTQDPSVQYVTINNSIVAGNEQDCSGRIDSGGYNLIGDTTSCQYYPAAGDLVGADPHLGSRLFFSNQAPYHPLLSGSPAINAADPTGCKDSSGVPITTDQRAAARLDRCDIGAYEYHTPGPAAILAAIGGTPQCAAPTERFRSPLQAAVLDAIGSPIENAQVLFNAPVSGPSGIFEDTGSNTTIAEIGEDGTATAASFWANSILGTYIVNANSAGIDSPAVFQLSNTIWFVSPTGDDTNNCDLPLQPCATINAALNKPDFTPGDTVWIASGVYTGDGDVFEDVVTINQEVNMVGGWNQSFSEQTGTTIIDGQHSRPVIRVNADAVVDRISIINGNEVLDVGYTIIVDTGALTLNNSSVYGGDGTGIYVVLGRLDLINSSVRDNEGGGIFVDYGGDVKVINSTISRNNTGGGISAYNSSVSLFNSTIYGNEAYNGGGIYSNSPVTLTNTILYGNIATVGPDCSLSETHSLGYNLIGDLTGCSSFVPDPTDKVGIDPRLGELISLPEYPAYYPLLEGSPAIDAGNPAECTDDQGKPLATDQRGKPRFSRCDIGAYEMQPLGYSTKEANNQAAIPGEVITYTIMLENPGMEEIPDVQLADNLPDDLNYVDGSLVATKGQPTYQNGLISWAGTLSAQEQVSVTFSATVDQLAPIFQPITNKAEIHGGGEIFPRNAIVLITQPYQVFCPLISRP